MPAAQPQPTSSGSAPLATGVSRSFSGWGLASGCDLPRGRRAAGPHVSASFLVVLEQPVFGTVEQLGGQRSCLCAHRPVHVEPVVMAVGNLAPILGGVDRPQL